MIQIDEERCIGCGACVKDCPGHALKMTENHAENTRPCIQCGHCVAVCPVKAVSIPEFDMEDVEEYERETFHVEPEHFLHALKFRRSIRNFTDRPLERETVVQILDAGRYTATAKNMQDCTFVFVQDRLNEFRELVWREMPGIIGRLKETAPDYSRAFELFCKRHEKDPENDTFFFNAPAFLLIASENPLDGGLAAANVENMAAAKGAGVLYSGYMMHVVDNSERLKEWLEVGEKKVSCCMLLGYPAVTYQRTAPRKKADIRWK